MINLKRNLLAPIMVVSMLSMTVHAQYYPSEVVHTSENGIHEVQKTYLLPATAQPTEEMAEGFILDGYEYTLMDMIKQEIPHFAVQEVVESVELNTKTNKLEDILPLLSATKEHTTEDGYMGELSIDVETINIEVAGYSSGSKTLTESRTYPNLSSADMSNIPQTITSGGTTYYFASVDWQTANDMGVDGHTIANRYTAVVKYTTSQKYSYVSGYTVTADYTGTLSKIGHDNAQYVAIFRGVEFIPEVETPEIELLPQIQNDNTSFQWQYIAIPLALLVFPIAAYFGIKAIGNKIHEKKEEF
ncbi:MAG: cell wall anchor protein [Eubacteriales bacterium]